MYVLLGDPGYPGPPGLTGLRGDRGQKGIGVHVISLLQRCSHNDT